MAKRAKERSAQRKAQGLCAYCGERPRFWGRHCIICRQMFSADPLPRGARRALRFHRAAEEIQEWELKQEEAARLLSSGRLNRRQSEVLILYMGLDKENGKLRTYAEIGALMNLSKERVRQLLLPAKLFLDPQSFDSIAQAAKTNTAKPESPSVMTNCVRCNNIDLIRVEADDCYEYSHLGLSDILLRGLSTSYCQACSGETVSLFAIKDLHTKLTRSMLLKPALLSGPELRFLRTAAGIQQVELAVRLGVTFSAILKWEDSQTLRFPNDLASRMVLAPLLIRDAGYAHLESRITRSIRPEKAKLNRVTAHWISPEIGWVVSPFLVISR